MPTVGETAISLMDEIDDFFTHVDGKCQWGEWGREFRVRNPEFVEDTLGAGLIEVGRRAREIADLTADTAAAELTEVARRMGETRASLATFLDQSDDGLVYWVEKNDREAISLNAAPVDVSEVLGPIFFESERPQRFYQCNPGSR